MIASYDTWGMLDWEKIYRQEREIQEQKKKIEEQNKLQDHLIGVINNMDCISPVDCFDTSPMVSLSQSFMTAGTIVSKDGSNYSQANKKDNKIELKNLIAYFYQRK